MDFALHTNYYVGLLLLGLTLVSLFILFVSTLLALVWLVSALSEIGEHDRARDLCDKLLAHASPLLLYAEELDGASGRHLGNFPQAFTHLALINAVSHVIAADG